MTRSMLPVSAPLRPLVAVLSCGRTIDGRAYQMVADRFLKPVSEAGGSVLVVPSLPEAVDAVAIASRCDALLMTGSCSNVSPARYGVTGTEDDADHGRDEVALAVAEAMVSAGRPVLGICRGVQELNVMFGGTLGVAPSDHMWGEDWGDPSVFLHSHPVRLAADGRMAHLAESSEVSVVSAHRRCLDRVAPSLVVEAVSLHDGVVEAVRLPGVEVVGVQWHPELGRDALSRGLFRDLVRAA